jgi:hypothetical protein
VSNELENLLLCIMSPESFCQKFSKYVCTIIGGYGHFANCRQRHREDGRSVGRACLGVTVIAGTELMLRTDSHKITSFDNNTNIHTYKSVFLLMDDNERDENYFNISHQRLN